MWSTNDQEPAQPQSWKQSDSCSTHGTTLRRLAHLCDLYRVHLSHVNWIEMIASVVSASTYPNLMKKNGYTGGIRCTSCVGMYSTLTHSNDGSPVRQEQPASPSEETWSKTHHPLKQSLKPAAYAALGQQHLREELVLPERVHWNQVSPEVITRMTCRLSCNYTWIKTTMWCFY